MKIVFLCFLMVGFFFSSSAQNIKAINAAALYNQLLQLKNCNTVLYVAAHPDDENTRLLTWMANVKNYRTAYVSLTRGDGGQNLIGSEQGEQLGIIRTQELLAARRIDGAQQFFTRAYDFGFSKTSEETLRLWDKEKVLSDLVFIIRSIKPDIVIARFPKDKRAGHGHHAASGILAEEAFLAAADPTKFPEQLKILTTHKGTRMLWNSFNFGSTNTTNENQFKINIGDYIPLLGKSVGELASESRSMHKSQGFGVALQRGDITEYFDTWQGTTPKNNLLDGVNTSWADINGGESIEKDLEAILSSYDFKQPSKVTQNLINVYDKIKTLNNNWHLKNYKLQQVKNLILQTAGINIEVLSTQNFIAQSDSLLVNLQVINRSDIPTIFNNASLFKNTIEGNSKLLIPNKLNSFVKRISNINSTITTNPYWLQKPVAKNMIQVETNIGEPENRSEFMATVNLSINGKAIDFMVPIEYKLTDPVKGEQLQPLHIVNNRKVEPVKNVQLMQGQKSAIVNYKTIDNLTFKQANEDSLIKGKEKEGSFTAVSKVYEGNLFAQLTYNKTQQIINYDHIPLQYYEKIAETKIVTDLIKIKGKNIGYINGAGDKVVESLKEMGYTVTILDKEKLEQENLNKYDAIIAGIRAYNTNAWLIEVYEKLMQYIFKGGNLIVQYNTNNSLGPLKNKIAPFNFNISRNRVTEENAKIIMAVPEHAIFNKPNKITTKDFEGWVQERSIYHAEAFDSSKFIAPIIMNDENEKPDNGSLIIAPYGKGNFVYTGIVFFRQLPAGVTGGYKLFANLIALGKK
jgi:LmbE family N-acetylglucosaminyl deacetylase